MENYYELLNLSPDTYTDELKKQIYKQMRVWSHRTNAPQIERRQEAERMIRILEEMEEILLDKEKRDEYDQQLRSFLGKPLGKKESEPLDEPAFNMFEPIEFSTIDLETPNDEATATVVAEERMSNEELNKQLEQGKIRLENNDTAQALKIAERLVKEVDTNPEVWAFMGQVHLTMLDVHEAMTSMIRARDLEPHNAKYVAQLGHIYLKQGNGKRARDQYKRAVSLDPKNINYIFDLGSLHIEQGSVREGMRLIEKCVKVAPNNAEYQTMLAKAYLAIACENWTLVSDGNPFLSSGLYPTEKADVKRAEEFLKKSSQFPINNMEIKKAQNQLRSQIERHKKRKFSGSWIMVLISFVSLFVTNQLNPSNLNMFFIGLPVLYILSGFAPSYRIYRNETQEKSSKTDFAYLFDKLIRRFGSVGAWLLSLILLGIYCLATAFFLSLVIIRNFYKNYLSTS